MSLLAHAQNELRRAGNKSSSAGRIAHTNCKVHSALTAWIVAFWLAIRVALHIRGASNGRRVSITQELILFSFLLYMMCVAAVTIMPLPFTQSRHPSSADVNLIPLLNMMRCLSRGSAKVPEGLKFCLENILGNIVLFVPLGLMLPLVYKKASSVTRILTLALIGSTGIELIQLFSRRFGNYRSTDVDDVILNTIGACLGYLCFAAAKKLRRKSIVTTTPQLRGGTRA